jgi:hypothetical protein
MPRVAAVRALEPFNVWLRFTDGREGVVSLDDLFSRGGVFEPLRDPVEFAKVRVERGFGAIEWPGPSAIATVDLDPDVLYAKVSGLPIEEVWKLG